MSEQQVVQGLIEPALSRIRASLLKEGADLQVTIDEQSHRVILQLVRMRIVCEDCLLPEAMVQKRIEGKLTGSAVGAKYQVETVWQ